MQRQSILASYWDWAFVTAPAWVARRLGFVVCDSCLLVGPRSWERARAEGWRSTTWNNPPDNHATLCAGCHADGE